MNARIGALALGLLTVSSLAAYLLLRSPPSVQLASPAPASNATLQDSPASHPTGSPVATVTSGVATDVRTESTAPSELPRYRGPERNAEHAALIREALIARKAVQAGTMPEPKGNGNQVDKPLGEYVARTMREQFLPLAGECYEALLVTQPGAAGNVALEFSVLGDPSVGGVVVDVSLGKETTLKNDEFRNCMSESMYAIVFDAPPGQDGSVSVKQSFELSP